MKARAKAKKIIEMVRTYGTNDWCGERLILEIEKVIKLREKKK